MIRNKVRLPFYPFLLYTIKFIKNIKNSILLDLFINIKFFQKKIKQKSFKKFI